MLILICVLIFCHQIVPIISNATCAHLADGGEVEFPSEHEIPKGYSLRDLLTVRGEMKSDAPNRPAKLKVLFYFVNKQELIARIYVRYIGTFGFTSKNDTSTVLAKIEEAKEDDASFLIQMRCHEMETTCGLTSQANNTVVSFNYQSATPDLLSTDRIRIAFNAKHIVQLRSIKLCRPTETSVMTELKLIDSQTEEKQFQVICRVTGLPVLTATWTKDGEETRGKIETNLEDSQDEQTLTLTHTVHGMRSEDTGIYECRGRSLLVSEEGVSSEVNVTMQSLENLIASNSGSEESDSESKPQDENKDRDRSQDKNTDEGKFSSIYSSLQ